MISIAASSLRRATIAPARNIIARNVSMTCENSVLKLNELLEEYRANNYSQSFPKRFQKDIVKAVKAATVKSRQLNVPSTAVSAEGIDAVLQNIGMGHRLSRSEIENIVSEVGTCPVDESGERHCVISANQMLDLISKK